MIEMEENKMVVVFEGGPKSPKKKKPQVLHPKSLEVLAILAIESTKVRTYPLHTGPKS